MAKKNNPPRPKDMNQLAKYIADISTGEKTETPKPTPVKKAKKKP